MGLLSNLLLAPFELVVEVIQMVFWVLFSCCEAVLNIVLEAVWFMVTTADYVLWVVSVIAFDWLPTLLKGLYSGSVATASMMEQVGALLRSMYQGCVMVLGLLVSGCSFVIQLPWERAFVTFTSATWNFTSSVSSLLYQQGGYTVQKASKRDSNHGALLRRMHALTLTAFLVGVITCLLLWCRLKKRRRERSVVGREMSVIGRENMGRQTLHLRNEQRQGRPECRPRSQDGVNATRETAPPVARQESTDSLTSTTELLRRQLHRANEELSQERDKLLCIVCLDGTREILLKPCNHYCLCCDCSQGLRECPMCKSRIQKTEKIFHA